MNAYVFNQSIGLWLDMEADPIGFTSSVPIDLVAQGTRMMNAHHTTAENTFASYLAAIDSHGVFRSLLRSPDVLLFHSLKECEEAMSEFQASSTSSN
jgi:hypothetical protein